MKSHLVFRAALFLGILAFGYGLTRVITPLSDLIGIEDALQLLLGSLLFVKVWKPAIRFFTERPLKSWRFAALSTALIAASFMFASIWAVNWRAFGYAPNMSDNLLRFGFRYLAVLGIAAALTTPEFEDEAVTAAAMRRIATTFLCVLLTAIVLVYGSRIRSEVTHDAAPTPPGLEDDP